MTCPTSSSPGARPRRRWRMYSPPWAWAIGNSTYPASPSTGRSSPLSPPSAPTPPSAAPLMWIKPVRPWRGTRCAMQPSSWLFRITGKRLRRKSYSFTWGMSPRLRITSPCSCWRRIRRPWTIWPGESSRIMSTAIGQSSARWRRIPAASRNTATSSPRTTGRARSNIPSWKPGCRPSGPARRA